MRESGRRRSEPEVRTPQSRRGRGGRAGKQIENDPQKLCFILINRQRSEISVLRRVLRYGGKTKPTAGIPTVYPRCPRAGDFLFHALSTAVRRSSYEVQVLGSARCKRVVYVSDRGSNESQGAACPPNLLQPSSVVCGRTEPRHSSLASDGLSHSVAKGGRILVCPLSRVLLERAGHVLCLSGLPCRWWRDFSSTTHPCPKRQTPTPSAR